MMPAGRMSVTASARRMAAGPARKLVEKCWDLHAVNDRYLDFAERWTPRLGEHRDAADGDAADPRASFVTRFALIHEFRAFPLVDPYLPRRLLPDGWHGEEATRVFHEMHDLLVGPADAYVDRVLAEAPVAVAR